MSEDPLIEKVARRAPSLTSRDVRSAIALFRAVTGRESLPPAARRHKLDALAGETARLSGMLSALPYDAQKDLRDAFLSLGHDQAQIDEIRYGLSRLVEVCAFAAQLARVEAKSGRPVSAQTKMIWFLAGSIEDAGGTADSKQMGELVQAFGLALDEMGLNVANERETVRAALLKWRANQSAPRSGG